MKVFLTALAYVGLAFVTLGAAGIAREVQYTLTAPESAYLLGSAYFEWSGLWVIACWVLATFGALLALTGGLIAKPRHLWIPMIAVGIIYVLSMGIYLYFLEFRKRAGFDVIDIALMVMSLLPGIACIIGALVLRQPKKKRRNPVISYLC